MRMLVLLPLSMWFTGVAIMMLWQWFVVPLGVPDVEMWHAAGLGALFVYPQSISGSNNTLAESTVIIFIKPALFLLIGYIEHTLMLAQSVT